MFSKCLKLLPSVSAGTTTTCIVLGTDTCKHTPMLMRTRMRTQKHTGISVGREREGDLGENMDNRKTSRDRQSRCIVIEIQLEQ